MSAATTHLAIASRWITHGAIRYHYRVAGSDESGTPLVLVHGPAVSSAYWRRIQPLLAPPRPRPRARPAGLAPPARTTRSPSTPGARPRRLA